MAARDEKRTSIRKWRSTRRSRSAIRALRIWLDPLPLVFVGYVKLVPRRLAKLAEAKIVIEI